MIVGLSGYAQVGKDTAAEVFMRHGFQHYSFADPMRAMAEAIDPIVAARANADTGELEWVRYCEALEELGYEEAKRYLPEIRQFLQRLGTDAGRNVLGEDVWVRAAIERMIDQGGDYVIPDVRFPNEAEAILDEGGALLRIVRPGYGPANDHESETALDHYFQHAFIINNGTISDLHDKVWQAYMAIPRNKEPSWTT